MEWAPSLSLAQESKQQGKDWGCRRRTSVEASRPPLLVLTSSRGRFAPCRTLAPTRAHLNPGQITVAGDTCRNHPSPAAPCRRIWFVLMCRERSPQARQRLEGVQATRRILAASGGISITQDGDHSDKAADSQRASVWRLGFLASPTCPAAKQETAGGSGEEPHLVLVLRLG